MVLHHQLGDIVFTSARHLPSFSSALKAELATCTEGTALALQWCSTATSTVLELDFSDQVGEGIAQPLHL